MNPPRPSVQAPVRGGKNVKTFRWDHRLQIQNLFMAFKRVPRPIGSQPYPIIHVVASPVRGLLDRISEEHLQSSNERKKHNRKQDKNDKKKKNKNKIHMPERDRRRAFDRESLV